MSRLVQRIKLGIIGQSGVGKTHFLHQFLYHNTSRRQIEPTHAVQFYQRIIKIGNEQISLRIWDSSVGYHLQQCQQSSYYTGLQEIQNWINRLKKDKINFNNKKILFIGNKLDLIKQNPNQRKIKYQDVKKILNQHTLPTNDIYQLTSNQKQPHQQTYIYQILQEIITEILQQRLEDDISQMKVKLGSQGILVTEDEEVAKDSAYCHQCNIY